MSWPETLGEYWKSRLSAWIVCIQNYGATDVGVDNFRVDSFHTSLSFVSVCRVKFTLCGDRLQWDLWLSNGADPKIECPDLQILPYTCCAHSGSPEKNCCSNLPIRFFVDKLAPNFSFQDRDCLFLWMFPLLEHVRTFHYQAALKFCAVSQKLLAEVQCASQPCTRWEPCIREGRLGVAWPIGNSPITSELLQVDSEHPWILLSWATLRQPLPLITFHGHCNNTNANANAASNHPVGNRYSWELLPWSLLLAGIAPPEGLIQRVLLVLEDCTLLARQSMTLCAIFVHWLREHGGKHWALLEVYPSQSEFRLILQLFDQPSLPGPAVGHSSSSSSYSSSSSAKHSGTSSRKLAPLTDMSPPVTTVSSHRLLSITLHSMDVTLEMMRSEGAKSLAELPRLATGRVPIPWISVFHSIDTLMEVVAVFQTTSQADVAALKVKLDPMLSNSFASWIEEQIMPFVRLSLSS
jgi:hypothetical protein